MNVVLICDYFLDYLGGAQTALRNQVAALRDAGHRVTVLTPARRGGQPTELGVTSPVVLPGLDFGPRRNSRRMRERIGRILDARSADVVHLHSEFGIAAAAIDAARARGIPVVHTVHTFFWRSGLRSRRLGPAAVRGFHRWLTGLRSGRAELTDIAVDSALRNMTLTIAERADVVVSPSEHQAQQLRAAGLEGVAVIPNAAPARLAAPARPLDTVEAPLRVLWAGRFVPEKRIVEFVEAAVRALDAVGTDRLQVTIAGEGTEDAAAHRAAAAHPGIRFTGRVDAERMTALLREAHLTVLSSFGFDNQPMTVVESISALRGMVYVDPRLTEGLDEAGIFCADASPDGMARRLVELATDPAPVLAASRRAVDARDSFSAETFAERMGAVYQTAVRETRSRNRA